MRRKIPYLVVMPLMLIAVTSIQGSSSTPAANTRPSSGQSQGQPPLSRTAREEMAVQEARRQKIAEKEAALAAKEEELKKLAQKIEAQLKSLDDTKKKYDEMVKAQTEYQKKLQSDKIQKMTKLFKTMKPAQSGKLMDSLSEEEAIVLLERLDTKTVAKLIPYLNQPRVVKWVDENLKIKR